MSYIRSGVRRQRRIGRTTGRGVLGDLATDIQNWWNGVTGGGGSPDTPQITGSIGPDESTSTSSSSTVQDTTQTSSGATVGGQDTGVPTAVGNWKTVAGVCYATNTSFLGTLKELQRQCNRVASAKGLTMIGVDGAVGPATLALMNSISGMGAYKSLANPDTSSCDAVCASVFSFIAATQSFADGLGAPSSVSSPSASGAPQVWNPAQGGLTRQPIASDISDVWGNLSSTNKMIVGAGVLGLAVWGARQGKKRRGRRV